MDPTLEDDVAAGRFGDVFTADHFVAAHEASASRDGSIYGLVVEDKATILIDRCPRATKSATDCIAPLTQFAGPAASLLRWRARDCVGGPRVAMAP